MGTCWHKKPDIGWTEDSLPESNKTVIFETSRDEFIGIYDKEDNVFVPTDLNGWLNHNYEYKSWNVLYWKYYDSPSKNN